MGFEDTARKAGLDLRRASHADVDAALAELHRAVPRRRRAHTGVAALAVAAALAIAMASSRWMFPDDSPSLQPAPQPDVSTSESATDSSGGYGCEHSMITCHGGRRSSVAMTVPMRWTIARDFNFPYSGASPTSSMVETYTRRGLPGGVTVLEGVSAAATQSEPAPVPGVQTAESFANWLAQRPFLSSSPVRTGSVDGYPAWIVDTSVRPGQPAGPATCTQSIDCYPTMLVRDDFVGIWEGPINRFTVLDLPGAGITVVWSWGLEGELPPAATDTITSIRFQ